MTKIQGWFLETSLLSAALLNLQFGTLIPDRFLPLLLSVCQLYYLVAALANFQAMNTSSAAPHVNFELLSRYQNRRVRLAGSIVSQQNDTMQVKAADEGTVSVKLSAPNSADAKFILITGMVTGRDSISEERSQPMGNDFGALPFLWSNAWTCKFKGHENSNGMHPA